MPETNSFDFPGVDVKQGSLAYLAHVRLAPYTFGGLLSSPIEPTMAYITDSDTTVSGAVISGGGTNKVLAWFNGINWIVIGSSGLAVSGQSIPNASGSTTTVAGVTTTAASATVTMAVSDFRTGQGILIPGAGIAPLGLGQPSALVATPTGTAGVTSHTWKVAAVNAAGGMTAAVSVTSALCNATLSLLNGVQLSWTGAANAVTYLIYRDNVFVAMTNGTAYLDGGWNLSSQLPIWAPTTPPAATTKQFYVGQVTLIRGSSTQITVSPAISTSVSGATAYHDDTAAIQAAVTAAGAASSGPTSGIPSSSAFNMPTAFQVEFPSGKQFNISSAITTSAAYLKLTCFGSATITQLGPQNLFIGANLNSLIVEHLNFNSGILHFYIGNANTNASNFKFTNCGFFTSLDHSVQTTGAYSTVMTFEDCIWGNCNGSVSSDVDILRVIGGWCQPNYHFMNANRGIFVQNHSRTYFDQIWEFNGLTGVPVLNDGVGFVSESRWVDCDGQVYWRSRAGGEFGGIPTVYVTSTAQTTTVPNDYQGAGVTIIGETLWANSSASTAATVVLRGLPRSISIVGARGPDGLALIGFDPTFNFTTAISNWKTGTGQTDESIFFNYFIDYAGATNLGSLATDKLWPKAMDYLIRQPQGFVKARAYRATAQTLTAGVDTKILLNTVSYDNNSLFSANSFIVKSTGYYFVTGQVLATAQFNNDTLTAKIKKNGVTDAWGSNGTTGAIATFSTISSTVSDMVFCTAGDAIQLYAQQSGAGPLLTDPSVNFLSVTGPFRTSS